MKGKLIVIDGADGSGKATQVAMLVERLVNEGVLVETIDFPRYKDNVFGKLVRECLDGKRGDFMKVDPRIASTLYAADRFETKHIIDGWLAEGKTVILDRYVSANMMHQGAKISDDDEAKDFLAWLDCIEHEIFQNPRPDRIIYLDVPHKVRFELIEADSTRAAIDVAEADTEHQIACETRAKKIIAGANNWFSIDCTKNGKMRSRGDIHEAVYSSVID